MSEMVHIDCLGEEYDLEKYALLKKAFYQKNVIIDTSELGKLLQAESKHYGAVDTANDLAAALLEVARQQPSN